MVGNPTLIKAIAVPLRREITIERIPELLCELDAAGLIVWYEVGGRQVIEFPTFQHHQHGLRKAREGPSILPVRTPDARLLRTNPHNQLDLLHQSAGGLQQNTGALQQNAGGLPENSRPREVEVEVEVKPSPPARAREAVKHPLDDATIAVVDDFLAQVPPDTSRRWVAMITGWLDGMDIRAPAPTPEDLRVGLTHYLAGSERDYSPMHVRTFVERAARERVRPTTSPPDSNGYHASNGDAAAAVFNDLVSWIQNAGGYKHITPNKFRELPDETREALREIGGHRAVAEADAKGLRILRAQFCRVYRARASPV